MALTGIGSLKHHVLSTKRAGFIFIFIVQTIKPGVDVKQHPIDIRKSEKQHQIGSMWPGLIAICLAQVKDELIQSYVYDWYAWTSEIKILLNDLALTSNLSVCSVFT